MSSIKINIVLNKNFVTQYNKLQAEYGTEIAALNGFGDEQLSYTDFINNFIDEQTVADSSIDGNSNVSHKDIVTLEREMPKPHSKLLAFNKIYYEIQKKYGFKAANEWLEMEWMGKLYMHDANSSTFRHYCYKDDECMTIKYNNETKYISFKNLYNLLENNEDICFDITINQDAFFPSNLYVLDLNDNKEEIWTKITRVVKHNNDKPMRFIKYGNGLSQIVTEDHPIITRNGEKKAKYVTEADEVYTQAPYKTETAISESYMTKDFGWLVGICLSEASTLPSEVRLKQNEKEQYNKIISILQKYNMPYTETTDNRINIRVSEEQKFLHKILNNTTAINKQLPPEHIYYPDEFMDGIIAGMIDGDGTIDGYKNRHCQIRIASEILCHQLSNYLQTKGVFCGDRTPYINNNCKTSFTQKLPIFGIGFSLTKEKYFSQIGSIKIKNKYQPLIRKGNFKNKQYQYEYGWVYVIENEEYIESCNEVYDITTETGHFLCNGVLSHNCFAYDLKDLAEKGLYFIDGLNGQPAKHLITFVDFIKEFVSFACNRSSGAVGLPNVIPYMYYFWKQDVDNDYLGIHTSGKERYYADQAFQRFIYAVNQPYVRDGSQSAFTNTSVFDRPYFEALFGGSVFPDGSFMIDYEEEIIEFQKWYMEVISDIRSSNMFTFPVSTISLLRKEGDFPLDTLDAFVDPEFAEWALKHNMKWSDSNIFVDTSVNSLSNCCRLKSDIRDLGYFNSVGGTALKVGSVKVSTINLARIALDTNSEYEYLKELEHRTIVNLRALDCVRHIIQRNVEKGLLPNFSYGLVDFEHLYNTIGFIGIYETMKKFGYTRVDEFGNTFYTDEASSFGKKIFEVMRTTADAFIQDIEANYQINTEQIPKQHWGMVA